MATLLVADLASMLSVAAAAEAAAAEAVIVAANAAVAEAESESESELEQVETALLQQEIAEGSKNWRGQRQLHQQRSTPETLGDTAAAVVE